MASRPMVRDARYEAETERRVPESDNESTEASSPVPASVAPIPEHDSKGRAGGAARPVGVGPPLVHRYDT